MPYVIPIERKKIGAVNLRAADLDADRPAMLRVLREALAPSANEQRFEWLYLRGPFGPARAWLLEETHLGTLVGIASAFPRLLCNNGHIAPGCVLGDFCLLPAWRSLGPGLQLQKACLRAVGEGGLVGGYDFPSAGMLAIYQRLGYQPATELVRFAKLLRVDSKLSDRIGTGLAATWLSRAGNLILRFKDTYPPRTNQWQISIHQEEIGGEFDELANRCLAEPALHVHRTAAYVLWRFRQHPYRRHEILIARDRNRLCGYLVLTQKDDQFSIVDVFGEAQPAMFAALIRSAADMARKRGAQTLSVSSLRSHAMAAVFDELGFREREGQPVIVFNSDGARAGQQWFLTDGDRES